MGLGPRTRTVRDRARRLVVIPALAAAVLLTTMPAGATSSSNGTVYAWGRHPQFTSVTAPLGITPEVYSCNVDCDTIPYALPVLALNGSATAVSAGYAHALARMSDGTVSAWGANYYGQPGDGTTTGRPLPVKVGGLNSVTAVASGGAHSLALRSDGSVWAWGDDPWNQLGDGGGQSRSTAAPVTSLSGTFTAIAA